MSWRAAMYDNVRNARGLSDHRMQSYRARLAHLCERTVGPPGATHSHQVDVEACESKDCLIGLDL